MQKICFYIPLFFSTIDSFSQIQNGSKVLTSTLTTLGFSFGKSETSSNVNPTQIGKGISIGLRPELTFGRVKNNGLFSYGLSLVFGWGKQSNTASGGFETKNSSIGISPVVSYQKFYSIANNLYFSPFSRLSFGYLYSKQKGTSSTTSAIQKGVVGSFEFRPFSLTFSKNAKTNFLLCLAL